MIDGTVRTADSVTVDGVTYCRLRDLAAAFNGTSAAFNVDWNGQVAITRGAAYETDPLKLVTGTAVSRPATLAASVDGRTVTTDAVNVVLDGAVFGNYYVSASSVADLLGVSAATSNGVLTVSAQ